MYLTKKNLNVSYDAIISFRWVTQFYLQSSKPNAILPSCLCVFVTMNINQILQKKLNTSTIELRAIGGGSVNETYKLITPHQTFFCKINSATKFPHLFQKEINGLSLIRKQKIIRVPEVIDCFEEDGKQFLVLQWIYPGKQNEKFWRTFGEQLAALHKMTNTYFGLSENNYMGSVLQQNHQHTDWNIFFNESRLLPLIEKCRDQQLLSLVHIQQFDNLIIKLADIFSHESPSLIHGDLWGGNFMCDEASVPVLIDPAVYYGHRSVDLAMTTLFGGFGQPFYEAYHYHFPLPPIYKQQWKVCNLYPLLIHLLLFGKGYLPQIETILSDFQ